MRALWALCLLHLSVAIDKGKKDVSIDRATLVRVPTLLYKDTEVRLLAKLNCRGKDAEAGKVEVKWVMRSTDCLDEYMHMTKSDVSIWYLRKPGMRKEDGGKGVYQKFEETISCNQNHLTDRSDEPWQPIDQVFNEKKEEDAKTRKRREGETDIDDTGNSISYRPSPHSLGDLSKINTITTTDRDAQFLLIIGVTFLDDDSKADLQINFRGPKGYLSAAEYPLRNFYLTMCIVYTSFALVWLLFSSLNYTDLLRIQFWIGGVIFVGMIEKAVKFAEYDNVNKTGNSIAGAEKFAEAVSAFKRATARMLVIIVSLGFGVIKPRLGPMLHRIVGVGALFFILASIEAFIRVDSAFHDMGNRALIFTEIPLAILDSIICWWIFVNLLSTMKTLRLRRNVIKLKLYRNFANIIIFMVLASVIFILWDINEHRSKSCLKAWDNMWLRDAFWHILFSIILFSIMILWRPSAMNQRYAYSPLVDGVDSDEEEEPKVQPARDTVKRRGERKKSETVDPEDKMEEDLKWIDENIPETVADAAIPTMLDSDEDVVDAKYEISKMQ
ncbi:Oidioi.mRNA.OKI2018_I69.XSR.g15579.t1.cds [Oikopleura dioica]|uniref:Oidioi.mRNA.OKI2018_I69.XSR.g15579.t1.cds n=1 Tax=Oikopleura dioica TaxID=34765 RepID=A0ABN7SDA4_OIKDI|nr:Oidioi.mRNA.OKI2018_I69.XSR.g15579.t1.cds [Oikopleura dioica]